LTLPPSLYAETAVPAPHTPRLDGDARADVCIIGAGFTGLSAALHLAEAGARVVVFEAEEPGYGASGRNGGQVNPGLKPDPDELEREFGPEQAGRMLALSYGAPDAVFDLIRRHQIECEARQGGTLRAAIGPRSAAAVRRTAEQCARRDPRARWLDAAETSAATGTDRYSGAMLDTRGGDLQPLSYARGLARAAMAQGARVHGRTRATKLHRGGALWQVETPRGTIRAEQVVLATNGYTDALWRGLARSVVPIFSSIAASAPMPDELVRRVLPLRASTYEAGHVTVYYRVDRANRLLIGGRGPQVAITNADPIRYLIAYAERLWPGAGALTWTHGWNGRLGMTADHLPHLHSPVPGLYAALGYNGRGVAMATAMGLELATWLRGGRPAMPVTDIRPMPFHGFWKLGVMAKVWEGRIRDRLGL
jgi:glycine/D-amino acid oxidase-like deaminating enzyme